MRRFKKAVGALVSTPVTFIIVDQLGLDEKLSVAITTAVTGAVVAWLRNQLDPRDGEL
jgi:hypothetical protein